MSESYYREKAEKLGLKILYSKTLDRLLEEQHEVHDRFPEEVEAPAGSADETIVCDRDEGYLSCILDVLAVCARFPGRKTWVIGFSEDHGYSLAHLFAADSVRAATMRVRKDVRTATTALRKAKRKAA